ncbi:MAG TPA: bifunctional nuclease family protein [Spirochaetia bacterium]|nr:bifunctional nuclease family protein [Spirochaetia bacterium]
MMNSEMVLTVRGIAIERKSKLPILFLSDRGTGRTIPIPIGPAEANSIILHMEGVLPPRPLTHDLFASFFCRHGFHLRSLELYGYSGDEVLARLRYSHGFRMYTMEVRPSDGVALAIRFAAPILASEEISRRPLGEGISAAKGGYDTSDFLYLEPEPAKVASTL